MENARLQSLRLPHSGAGLATPPIPALGVQFSAKEFQVSVKYRLGIAVYDQKENVLIAFQVHWTHLVTMPLPAV